MPANNSVQKVMLLVEEKQLPILGVKVGQHTVQPGTYIPRAEAQGAPEISLPTVAHSEANSGSGPYLAVCLDLDAPFQSAPILGPILHWIQPGFSAKGSATDGDAVALDAATTPFVADYIGPAPPPFAGPHRYVFFLYQQPQDFDATKYAPANGQKMGPTSRMWYDLDAFEADAKLGAVLAANYFTSN